MKNLALFVVVMIFWAVPMVTAQSRSQSQNPAFNSLFGGRQPSANSVGGVAGISTADVATAETSVSEKDDDDLRNLARNEIRQTFADKSFTVVETEEESATYTIEVAMFSRQRQGCYGGSYSYCYHRLPEDIAWVTVRDRATGAVISSGEGKKKDNLHIAIENAAKSAAEKLKKKSNEKDRVVFLP